MEAVAINGVQGELDVRHVEFLTRVLRMSPGVAAVVETVVTYATETGMDIGLYWNSTRVKDVPFFSSRNVERVHLPLSREIIRHILVYGFAPVITPSRSGKDVDEQSLVTSSAKNIAYVPLMSSVTMRWVVKRGKPIFQLMWRESGSKSMTPIRNADLLIRSAPHESTGQVVSPLARALPSLAFRASLGDAILSVSSDRARAGAITISDAKTATKQGGGEAQVEAVPFMWNSADMVDEHVTEVTDTESEMYKKYKETLEQMSMFKDANQDYTSGGFADSIPGRKTLTVPPGKQASSLPMADTVADVRRLREDLLAEIGFEFGLSRDVMLGTSSNVVAGVVASRKQLGVVVNSIQSLVAEFLETIISKHYKHEILAIMETEPASDSGAAMSKAYQNDYVEVKFNSSVYLDLDTLMAMHAKGILSDQATTERALRMYGLRFTEAAADPATIKLAGGPADQSQDRGIKRKAEDIDTVQGPAEKKVKRERNSQSTDTVLGSAPSTTP